MASKWSLNERTARKLDKAASAAVKDALDTMDALKAAEEGGSVERAEKVSGMSEEELFSFAEYDPHKGEKIGYTEYSYWRSTLRTFLHNKVALFFLACCSQSYSRCFLTRRIRTRYSLTPTALREAMSSREASLSSVQTMQVRTSGPVSGRVRERPFT